MKSRKFLIPAVLFTALSVLTSLLFCGFRIGFVFVDHVVFDSLCYLLWGLFIVNSVFMFAHLRSCLIRKKPCGKALFIINCIITAVSVAASTAFFIIGKDELLNYVYVSVETLPVLAVFYGLIFFIAVFPICAPLFRKCVAVVAAVACVAVSLAYLFPAGGFDFESAPAVFDTGDSYRVIFATNRKSIGYVSYNFEGKSYTVWDTTTGRKDASVVHSVEVPYKHINNNAYSIGAVRATEEIAYGGHLGKEITYTVEKFTPCPQDDFNMAVITDNHGTRVDWDTVAPNAQLFTFLGDIANGLYSYNSFIDNLIVPAGEASMGAVPVIYARGNHDHRGSVTRDMLSELDFDKYYYRVRVGEYVFTVMDTGEDKEDDNYEYGGYNDYASYYAEQTEWARSLKREKGYNVIIAHSASLFDSVEGSDQQIAAILKELGEEFSISGHSHDTRFVTAEDSSTGIPYYISGCFDGKRGLKYTEMHFKNGHIDIVSKNMAGDVVCTADMQLHKVSK